MSIEAIGFIAPLSEPSLAPLAEAQAAAPSGKFGAFFDQQMSQVNQDLLGADKSVMQLAAGQATNLHDVMLRLEQAQLSFQLLAQVRNKVMEAYQEVSRMQI